MRSFRLCVIFLWVLPAVRALAQPPAAHPGVAQEASVSRQLQSVSSMQASLASQRAAIRGQGKQEAADSFFLLEPPPRMATRPAAAPGDASEADCAPLPEPQAAALISEAARRVDLPPEILRGIVKQESAFRPCAVSPKGALGLMQLMPATAAQAGVGNPFDPQQNVEAGARLFKRLLDFYGDLPRALGAYNAGASRVNEANGVPNIPETLNYVQTIMSSLPLGLDRK